MDDLEKLALFMLPPIAIAMGGLVYLALAPPEKSSPKVQSSYVLPSKPEGKFITANRISFSVEEIDPNNEGIEQILTIDGKKYVIGESDNKPTIIPYE